MIRNYDRDVATIADLAHSAANGAGILQMHYVWSDISNGPCDLPPRKQRNAEFLSERILERPETQDRKGAEREIRVGSIAPAWCENVYFMSHSGQTLGQQFSDNRYPRYIGSEGLCTYDDLHWFISLPDIVAIIPDSRKARNEPMNIALGLIADNLYLYALPGYSSAKH